MGGLDLSLDFPHAFAPFLPLSLSYTVSFFYRAIRPGALRRAQRVLQPLKPTWQFEAHFSSRVQIHLELVNSTACGG